jgi:hypothetical protein
MVALSGILVLGTIYLAVVGGTFLLLLAGGVTMLVVAGVRRRRWRTTAGMYPGPVPPQLATPPRSTGLVVTGWVLVGLAGGIVLAHLVLFLLAVMS